MEGRRIGTRKGTTSQTPTSNQLTTSGGWGWGLSHPLLPPLPWILGKEGEGPSGVPSLQKVQEMLLKRLLLLNQMKYNPLCL